MSQEGDDLAGISRIQQDLIMCEFHRSYAFEINSIHTITSHKSMDVDTQDAHAFICIPVRSLHEQQHGCEYHNVLACWSGESFAEFAMWAQCTCSAVLSCRCAWPACAGVSSHQRWNAHVSSTAWWAGHVKCCVPSRACKSTTTITSCAGYWGDSRQITSLESWWVPH